jgi:hypothetical protein
MRMTKIIPFQFVLEKLNRIDPIVKPMFGCHAVYVREKIVLILRQKENAESDNGVWIATSHEHHASLKKDFPSLRSIQVFGENGGWQIIPEDADDFEESVFRVCELILKNDPRLGKIPKAKKKK